jgi:DNA topoisomerase-2
MPPRVSKSAKPQSKSTKSDSKTTKKVSSDEESESDEKEVKSGSSSGSKTKTKNTKKEIVYNDLSLHEQILLRPDTYIGGTSTYETPNPIWVNTEYGFALKKIKTSNGIMRIFIEPSSNAVDNVWRSSEYDIQMTTIKYTLDKKTGLTSVWNDGKAIPIKKQMYKQDKKEMWLPEIIFSKLLTSSNYDDEDERKTSGRNGFGIKLCNIFSTNFYIEIYDPESGQLYTQTWENNMHTRKEPKITKMKHPSYLKKGSGYTLVKWIPDFKRFKLEGYTEDLISHIEKIIYHTASYVSEYKIEVEYNEEPTEVNSLLDYAKKFYDEEELDEIDEKKEILEISTDDCKMVVMPNSNGTYNLQSSVNGIETRLGGTHVTPWEKALFSPIVDFINGTDKLEDKINKKTKDLSKAEKKKVEIQLKKQKTNVDNRIKIDISHVRKYLSLFVSATLTNPTFESQEKHELKNPTVNVSVDQKKLDKYINAMKKWEFITLIKESLDAGSFNRLDDITKDKSKLKCLDDANLVKGNKKKYTEETILVATEGLSAKTFIVSGILKGSILEKSGRDYIGIITLKGKFINGRKATVAQLEKNTEVRAFIRALNLKNGVDYSLKENYETLRYKKLVISADQDKDGIHIISLVYNFFHARYPTLLKLPDFFYFMRTPLVRISKGVNNSKGGYLDFYSQERSGPYISENKINKSHIKYYKGLGSWKANQVCDVIGKKMVSLVYDENCDRTMDNIFNKDTEFRKGWISNEKKHKEYVECPDFQVEKLDVSEFIDQEMVEYSKDHCRRAIPCIYDGLNESQRKILYTAFLKKLKYEGETLKVAQFAGTVAEKSGYHHGETILFGTITGMVQRFVGSNNIPYFFDDGQFGTRLQYGNDAANGRYIFTKLDMMTRYLFREEDDKYLINQEDDGDIIEPECYYPILPTILINGANGIGTGFSTNIPCYNPLNLVSCIESLIENNFKIKEGNVRNIPVLHPWYRNFKGKIELDLKQKEGGIKYTTRGVVENMGGGTYRVSELPVGRRYMSIDDFKEFLEEQEGEKKSIKKFTNYSGDNFVNFLIEEDKDEMAINENTLKLTDTLSLNNMVLFKGRSEIKKYKNVDEILEEFCKVRLAKYVERKAGMISEMENDMIILKNKIRFITEVNNGKIKLKGKTSSELMSELEKLKYDKRGEEKGYVYLTSMQIGTLTSERVEKLESEYRVVVEALEELRNTSPSKLWLNELEEFKVAYTKWLANNEIKEEGETTVGKGKAKRQVKSRGKKVEVDSDED